MQIDFFGDPLVFGPAAARGGRRYGPKRNWLATGVGKG